MIFNVQKCSIHDGVGLRTLVFFKGCPLSCLWCANPESKSFEQEVMEVPRKCVHCGACQMECPEFAIFQIEGEFKINRKSCTKCFKCVDVCYAESKKLVGEKMDSESLFKEINKDRLFYELNGGGVTFSGGEPLMQPEFLAEIAKKCKENGINTSIETCAYGDYEKFKEALLFMDSMFIDIKHIDSNIHKKLTGLGNELILKNIEAISKHNIPITIRTPIVPGLNDSVENIKAIASFIKDIPSVIEYELLPYHRFGNSKYQSLGESYTLENLAPPSEKQIERLVKLSNLILQPNGKQAFYTKNNQKEIIL